MELMIVMAIIGILMTFGLLPYKDYMDRAELSNNIDTISQEWILAHKEIRNWLENSFTNTEDRTEVKKHSAIIFEFKKWESKIKKYEVDFDEVSENKDWKNIFKNPIDIKNILSDNTKIKKYKEINFSKNIEIKEIFEDKNLEKIFYITIPPFAQWKFFDESWVEKNFVNPKIQIGYQNATIPTDPNIKTPKIRTILLNPYLQ